MYSSRIGAAVVLLTTAMPLERKGHGKKIQKKTVHSRRTVKQRRRQHRRHQLFPSRSKCVPRPFLSIVCHGPHHIISFLYSCAFNVGLPVWLGGHSRGTCTKGNDPSTALASTTFRAQCTLGRRSEPSLPEWEGPVLAVPLERSML